MVNNSISHYSYARVIAINIACTAQMTSCISKAHEKLLNFVENGVSIEPDLLAPVLCHGIKNANEETFSKLLKMFESSSKTSMRNNILNSLGCSQNSTMLQSFLLYAIDSENSLKNDERSRILTSAINQGEMSIHVLIHFVEQNSEEISRLGFLFQVLTSISSRIHNQELLTKFLSLLDNLQSSELISEENVTTYKNSGNELINWQKKNILGIKNFLEDQETTTFSPRDTSTTQKSGDDPTLGAKNFCISINVLFVSFFIKLLM